MAGPAIRAWNLAETLAATCDVTLLSTVSAKRKHPVMKVGRVTDDDLGDLLEEADAVVAPTSVVRRHPVIAESGKPLAIDMYIPTQLENLEPGARPSPEHEEAVAHQVAVVNEDLSRGDFFICAHERQRDFWLGGLSFVGRINPSTYDDDQTLRRLIDAVPFGLPAQTPQHRGHVLRARFDAIGEDDPVVVWGGGIYEWFDPLSLVRAVASLRKRLPRIRLVFFGMRNPNPNIPQMSVATELRALSEDLALSGSNVFFFEGWVPYDQWPGFLLDADVCVSTHLGHVETRFSSRTRVLDYIWTRRPMLLTEGDPLSELVVEYGLGVTVAPGDTDAIADGLAKLLLEGVPDADFESANSALRWPAVAAPLVRWCRSPRRAPDLGGSEETEIPAATGHDG